MFAKVLKYEAKETGLLTLVLAIAGGLIIFLSGLAVLAPDGPLAAIRGLSLATGVLIGLALPCGLFFPAAVRYWRTMYGQRGYFTQTLPVGSGVILAAKTLWLMLVTGVSMVLFLGALLWMTTVQTQTEELAMKKGTWTIREGIDKVIGSFHAAWAGFPDFAKWAMIAILIMGIIETVVGMLFASALSNWWPFSAESPGLGFTLAAVVTYAMTQVFGAIVLFVIPGSLSIVSVGEESKLEFVKGFFWHNLVDSAGASGSENYIPLGTLLLPLMAIAMYVFAHYSLTRRLNLR